jgi:hypothetical protein
MEHIPIVDDQSVIGSVSSSWGPGQMVVDNEMEHIPISLLLVLCSRI